MKMKQLFEDIKNKTGISVEILKNEYDELLKETKEERIARVRLYVKYKRMLMSTVKTSLFQGVIFGVGETRNIVEFQKNKAINMWNIDKEEAIRLGYTDSNGVPLEMKKEFSPGRLNPNYRKPLPEERLMRKIQGIAVDVSNKSSPKKFTLNLNGEQTKLELPCFKPVEFHAIVKSKDEDSNFVLNGSKITRFNFNPEINLPMKNDLVDIEFLCNKICKPVKLADITEWHENNRTDNNEFICFEGFVNDINPIPSKYGSIKINLIDPDMPFNTEEQNSIAIWYPASLPLNFNFSARVLVFGTTSRRNKIERQDDGSWKILDEPGEVTINATGIYPCDGIEPAQTPEQLDSKDTSVEPAEDL